MKKYSPFKKAFTLLEMIIVMVVLGIIANFGVEMLVNTYQNYIFTSVQNRLQSQSEAAVKQIANRLEYRIKDSVIAKNDSGTFHGLVSAPSSFDATVLEWIGSDREGWLGDWNVTTAFNTPHWSGFIDIGSASTTNLLSPQTNTVKVDSIIKALSNNGSIFADAAFYSIEGTGSINSFGWSGALLSHNGYLHRIQAGVSQNRFAPKTGTGNFNKGGFITEFYKLTWTAYAIKFEDRNGDGSNELWLYYDYQPWAGETYSSASTKSFQLMDNVTTFGFKADGSVINIQVCVSDKDLFNDDGDNNDTTGAYSICKEKTVF